MELKGFRKLNEAVSPELLKDDELTKLEDAVLDKEFGRPLKRNGWAKFNTNVASDTILSLHEVVTSNGSNYLLAGARGELQKSLDGTGTFSSVTTKGTPPYRMQAYADEFIFTDGLVSPFVVTGDTLGTVYDLEIEAPDIVGAGTIVGLNSDAGGNLGVGFYKWIIIYVSDTGQYSAASIPICQLTDAFTKRIGFNNLPVSADPRITHRNIYRTLVNSDVFYFHTQLDNTVTKWIDNKADADLGSETFNYVNAPKTSKYISLHKERIVLANNTRLIKAWQTPAYSKTGGSFTISTYTFSGATASQAGFLNSEATTGGSLSAGTYTYRAVFYDAEGLMSDYVESNGVVVDGSTNKSVNIYNYPTVSKTFDVIKRAELYRSKDGGAFKLIYQYEPQRDDSSWVGVPTLLDNGIADGATYSSTQETKTEKCSVAFSEIGEPASFPLENIRDVFPDDGDQITGVYDDIDGFLIFKENSICKIWTGSGSPDNWRVTKLLTNIGADDPNAIIKYGNTYVFKNKNEIYKFSSGGTYENIGLEIQDTLKLVTAWHSAIGNDRWYIFGVTCSGITGGYGFLIFDYIVGSWYLFSISGIPYVLRIKEHGSTVGTILTSYDNYIIKYGTGTVDTEIGSQDIVPIIRTKTFGEQISLLRLRKVKFNYKKLDSKTLTITVVNPDTGVTNTYSDTTDSTNTSDFKLYESGVRESTDSLKTTPKFYVNVTGAGFAEWGNLRIEARPILRGKRDV